MRYSLGKAKEGKMLKSQQEVSVFNLTKSVVDEIAHSAGKKSHNFWFKKARLISFGVLIIIGGSSLAACGVKSNSSPTAASQQVTQAPTSSAAVDSKNCSVTQSIEEGPYYLADTPTRTDVTDGQVGSPLSISFTVLDEACNAVEGARIDIWYANADGIYSGVASQGDDLGAGVNSGNFLRGTQITNAAGVATFKGIYPGWYPARTIHIHEKVWIGNKEVLTTQTYFTDEQNAVAMANAPYNLRGTQKVTNPNDMLLKQGGINLDAALMELNGSQASFSIVVKN